jgi:hypothetical protein
MTKRLNSSSQACPVRKGLETVHVPAACGTILENSLTKTDEPDGHPPKKNLSWTTLSRSLPKAAQYGGAPSIATPPSIPTLRRGRDTVKEPGFEIRGRTQNPY